MEKRVSLQEEVVTILSRLRMLEDKQANLQRKLHMLEEHTSMSLQEVREKLSMLEDELLDVQKRLKDMHELVDRLAKSFSQVAMKDELRMLEKYVNLMDPTLYVTREHVRKLIREEMEKLLEEAR